MSDIELNSNDINLIKMTLKYKMLETMKFKNIVLEQLLNEKIVLKNIKVEKQRIYIRNPLTTHHIDRIFGTFVLYAAPFTDWRNQRSKGKN